MNKRSKIIDNPTSKEMLEQFQAFDSFEALYRAIPFSRKLFPKFDSVFESFSEIKKQAIILQLPDKFNEIFSSQGWIAYESMNVEIMKKSIEVYESEGIEKAEIFLASSYDSESLKWGIQWFNGHSEFRRRIRLANLAREDYLAERYHACIPLLLSLLDGLVNDVSKHVGFFAEKVDLTAWDSIAAHETGLQSIAQIMTLGRNKTNEEEISIPYRNGILHGRELEFDNKLVAAKCWSALFATRDWAIAISDGKKTPKPKEKVSWKELLSKLAENGRNRKLLEEWKPRTTEECKYLPYSGCSDNLPCNTPERAVAIFIDNWVNRRYGLIAEALLYFTDTSKGKKAGLAKEDFSRYVPLSFKILSVEDQAAAVSHVIVELTFDNEPQKVTKELSIRTIYQDKENNALVRSVNDGVWKILQNSFSEVIYAINL